MSFSEESNEMLLACFRIGNANFGVDARLVQEVVKSGEITTVHDAPPEVVGIRNLRGRIITVIDLAAHLDLGQVEETGPGTKMLIMEHLGESYGFLVDAVTEAFAMDEKQIAESPPNLDPVLRERLLGVWRDHDELTAILDSSKFFEWQNSTQ